MVNKDYQQPIAQWNDIGPASAWQLDAGIPCSHLANGTDGQTEEPITVLLYAPYRGIGHHKMTVYCNYKLVTNF